MIARPAFLLIGLAALTLSLSGCGRKGPLDLPPTAQAKPAAATVAEAPRDGVPGAVFDQSTREEVEEARGKKRRFILDPLLGE